MNVTADRHYQVYSPSVTHGPLDVNGVGFYIDLRLFDQLLNNKSISSFSRINYWFRLKSLVFFNSGYLGHGLFSLFHHGKLS